MSNISTSHPPTKKKDKRQIFQAKAICLARSPSPPSQYGASPPEVAGEKREKVESITRVNQKVKHP